MRFTLHKKHTIPLTLWLGIGLIFLFAYALWFMEQHLKPALISIAEARATQIATQSINDVIYEKVSGDINSESLVMVKLDQQGRVVFIQPNTVEMNKLSSDATLRIQAVLKNLSEEKIDIPLGQAFGNPLFAALGPRVSVTVIPIGTIEVKFLDKFEQAGINQTKHRIFLSATARVNIVVPLVSKEVIVNTQIPVTEYVVVGDVPSTYVQIPMAAEEQESKRINDTKINQ